MTRVSFARPITHVSLSRSITCVNSRASDNAREITRMRLRASDNVREKIARVCFTCVQ